MRCKICYTEYAVLHLNINGRQQMEQIKKKKRDSKKVKDSENDRDREATS